MERQLELPALPDETRVQFCFALAKAREDRGDYARAFELYATAIAPGGLPRTMIRCRPK